MSNITDLFEQEVVKKIQAKNSLDKKLEISRLGFNRGISYLENLCEELQDHIPSLGCELKMGGGNSVGHFIFKVNGARIPIQLWGRYNEDGSCRTGFGTDSQEFSLCYRSAYWKGGSDFEKQLVAEIVSKLDVVQMS